MSEGQGRVTDREAAMATGGRTSRVTAARAMCSSAGWGEGAGGKAEKSR